MRDGMPDVFPDKFQGAGDMLLRQARDWIRDEPDATEIALRLDRTWRCDTGQEEDCVITSDEPSLYHNYSLNGIVGTMTKGNFLSRYLMIMSLGR